MKSLRPVLESIFHRMLLYSPAVYRHEALITIAEVNNTIFVSYQTLCLKTYFNSFSVLYHLSGFGESPVSSKFSWPTIADNKSSNTATGTSKKRLYSDVALLKL